MHQTLYFNFGSICLSAIKTAVTHVCNMWFNCTRAKAPKTFLLLIATIFDTREDVRWTCAFKQTWRRDIGPYIFVYIYIYIYIILRVTSNWRVMAALYLMTPVVGDPPWRGTVRCPTALRYSCQLNETHHINRYEYIDHWDTLPSHWPTFRCIIGSLMNGRTHDKLANFPFIRVKTHGDTFCAKFCMNTIIWMFS